MAEKEPDKDVHHRHERHLHHKGEGKAFEKEARPLLNRVREIFMWIGRQIVRAGETQLPPPQPIKAVQQYTTKELIRRAESAVAQLELSKQLLLEEYGESAHGFILRYVDPVVEPVKRFIAASAGEREAIERVVGTVEMLNIMQDEMRLRRKIRDTLEEHTRQVILEDIAFIMSYPSEAIEEAMIPVHLAGTILREVEHELQPILLQLETLLSIPPPSHEFIPIFQWRVTLDARRQQLHDHALQVIDGHIQRSISSSPPGEIASSIVELLGETPWPLSLYDLDELATRLHQRFIHSDELKKDARAIAIFDFLRSHLNDIVESEEYLEHDALIERVLSSMRDIEDLLRG